MTVDESREGGLIGHFVCGKFFLVERYCRWILLRGIVAQ